MANNAAVCCPCGLLCCAKQCCSELSLWPAVLCCAGLGCAGLVVLCCAVLCHALVGCGCAGLKVATCIAQTSLAGSTRCVAPTLRCLVQCYRHLSSGVLEQKSGNTHKSLSVKAITHTPSSHKLLMVTHYGVLSPMAFHECATPPNRRPPPLPCPPRTHIHIHAARSDGLHTCRAAALCSEHSQGQWHPDLRRVAFEYLMRMAYALQGLDAAVTLALDALASEIAPLVR